MPLQFAYGSQVLTLPASAARELKNASLTELRALLALSQDLSLAEDPKALSKEIGCREKEAKDALAKWRDLGVLVDADATVSPACQTTRLRHADEIPRYSTSELADLLERRESVRVLLDEAQSILGKLFTPAETNLVIGMVDYLGLSEEAVLLTLAHCKKIGKTNLRAIEKYAITLCDKGVTDPASMEEEFLREEAFRSFEGELRSLFGLKSRALSAKEERFVANWIAYGYDDMEIIRRAYDITVDATSEASLPYANAILETWHALGLSSLEEIDRHLAEEAERKAGKKKGKEPTLGNSFNDDDFFAAALRRSFGSKKKGDEK